MRLGKVIHAESDGEAITEVENVDCQHDGNYVEDSFEIVGVAQITEHKKNLEMTEMRKIF